MTTVATLPVYPVPKRPAEVSFALTESGANYVRVWCTVAPDGSNLATELKKTAQSRVKVYEGDGGAENPWRFTPEKGGKYTLVSQEYTRGSSYGGGYQDDPNGALSETKTGSETTLSLYIGQRLTQKIGVAPDTATLVLWVWNATIRETTLGTHGEVSPSITATTPTPRAKAAIEAAAVYTAYRALIDVAVSTATGTLATIVSNMFIMQNAHNDHVASHAAVDNDNDVAAENAAAPSPKELPQFVNDALQKMRRHRMNDSGAGVGSATSPYHEVGGAALADYTNMPLYQSVGNLEDAYGALADIYRAHEGHRASTTVHTVADNTHVLNALPALLEVHRQFLTVISAVSPVVPPAQSSGAMTLISQAGFAES